MSDFSQHKHTTAFQTGEITMFNQNSPLHISEECQCQEVVVVTLIRAAKGWWAETTDNVRFPGELKSGKIQQRCGLGDLPFPQGAALYIYMHECMVNGTANVFQHEHDLNMIHDSQICSAAIYCVLMRWSNKR